MLGCAELLAAAKPIACVCGGVLGLGLPMGGLRRLLGEAAQSLGLARPPREAMGRDIEALGLVGITRLCVLGDSGGVAAWAHGT